MGEYEQALRVGDKIELQSKDGILQTERVIGGIVPASDISPYYACAFGQMPHANKSGKKPMLFLGEAEHEMPEPFLDQLAALARKYFSWTWYYNVSDSDDTAIESLYHLLNEYRSKFDITQIKLREARVLNWAAGVSLIQQWAADEALEITSGTILSGQLGRMGKTDRMLSRRHVFYAVDALRAVISRGTPVYRFGSSKTVRDDASGFCYC